MEPQKSMDVIAPRDRSIRKIPLRGTRKPTREKETDITSDIRNVEPPNTIARSPQINKRGPLVIVGFVVLALILCGFLYQMLFAAGRLVITPKNQTVIFDKTIVAVRDSGTVSFETMTIEKVGEKEAESSSEAKVEERASGTIIVYNNYSTEPQRLIKNTRFESQDGLIFRISDSVVVPGQKKESGETVPGSLEVRVLADAPGEEYNIGLSDWTIPGFKGDPRYDKFYARSKEPMKGGFVGLKKIVSDTEKEKVRLEIQQELTESLFKEASESLAEDFVLYRDAIFIEFESLPDESKGDKALIKEKAILYGVLFDRKVLSEYIASQTIADYVSDNVLVENLDDLDFTTIDKTSTKPWLSGEISFTLLGNPLIVWQFDEEKLKTESAGKLKKEVRGILTTYPSILRADISVRPFWKRRLPENPERVKIIKKIEPSE